MPTMKTRHGRQYANLPSRISEAQGQANRVLSPKPDATDRKTPVSVGRSPWSFLEDLPNPNISHVSLAGGVVYDAGLSAGTAFPIFSTKVPDGRVWAITDVTYYATAPGAGYSAAPVELPPATLSGLIRFQFLTNQRSEGGTRAVTVASPYGTAAAKQQQGWYWLERPFGPTRGPSFAFYATSGSNILVQGIVDDPPRFPISQIGVRVEAFALTDTLYSRIWRVD
jgi:hypothetical protein